MMKNNRATYALVYGILSLVLALLTLASGVGFAGLITGTFAIVYGVQSRNAAKRFPGIGGEGKALAGIILGAVALGLLVLSLLRNL